MATISIGKLSNRRTGHDKYEMLAAESIPISSIRIAKTFACERMIPCFCQSDMIGPNILEDISQASSLADPLAKQKAASKMNGTVGNTGKSTPITPKNNETSPPAINIERFMPFAMVPVSFMLDFATNLAS